MKRDNKQRQTVPRLLKSVVLLGPAIGIVTFATLTNRWHYFFSDTHDIRYTDLRPITANVTCRNLDPTWNINESTCDPWNRILNYPRIWLDIFDFFGLNDSRAVAVGIAISCVFFSALVIVSSRYATSILTAIFVGLLAVSPPVFFVLERGNVDALIFALLVIATVSQESSRRAVKRLGKTLVVLAAYLKIFPLGSLASLTLSNRLTNRRALLRTGLKIGVIGSAIAIALMPEASRIFSHTPAFPAMQFGIRAIPAEIGHCLPVGTTYGYCSWTARHEFLFGYIFVGVLATLLFVAAALFRIIREMRAEFFARLSQFDLLILLNFGGAFLFTFVLGANWYYRLIFLIPVGLAALATRTFLGYLMSSLIALSAFMIAGNVIYLVILSQFLITVLFSIGLWLIASVVLNARKQLAHEEVLGAT